MSYTILDSIKRQDEDALREQLALDILMGFSSSEKYIPSKYFYDAAGSERFSRITETTEYYPTRCEFEIFHRHQDALVSAIAGPAHRKADFHLVELGAGDGRKTKVLLQGCLDRQLDFEYLPLDISEAAVANLGHDLDRELPGLRHHGVIGDYLDGLKWIERHRPGRLVVFFLGSNIGNFTRPGALVFLRTLWKVMNAGDLLLIGFDLKKSIDVLLHAYNDAAGHTAAFNLNVLARLNRELGADFNLEHFEHFGTYMPKSGAMESYLVSLQAQRVTIAALEKSFDFGPYEAIHMEYSYKYHLSDIQYLARETGFQILDNYFDDRHWYVDSLWRVEKDPLSAA